MLVAGIGLGMFALTSRSGWFWDHASAASWAVTSTVLIGPIVAGLVAHDTWRAASPAMAVLARQSRRGGRAAVAPAGAIFAAGLCVLVLTVGVAHVTAAVFGADGTPDVLVYVQGVVALVASAALGLLTGRLVRGFLTGPLAAALGYMLPILLKALGASEVMVVRGSAAPATFLRVTVEAAGAQIVAAAGLALLGVAAVSLATSPRFARYSLIATCGIVLVGGLAWSIRAGDAMAVREVGPIRCVDDLVVVCGPTQAGRIVEVAARDLSEAARELHQYGLDTRGTTLELTVGGARPTDGRGELFVPSGMRRAGLSDEEVVMNLVTPADCDQLRADVPPEAMMPSMSSLGDWMLERLSTEAPGAAEDSLRAQAVFDAMSRCVAPPAFDYMTVAERESLGR